MTFQQLRYLCAVVDGNFNISQAALAVSTSQPGISTQIRLLERELETDILLRRRGRIVGLTEPGKSILETARRMLREADNLGKIGAEYGKNRRGAFSLGMTHTHARYGLLNIIERFRHAYPEVQLILREASPPQVFELISSGQVDMGVVNEIPADSRNLVALPCPHSNGNNLARTLIVPRGHPLLSKKRRLTLKDVAAYPLIMMDNTTTGARAVLEAFREGGLEPDIVMRANAPDVIKAYVELGFGIAVLPAVAYDAKLDRGLRSIETSHLFGTGILAIALDPNAYLRGYMYDFIALVTPGWTREAIDLRLNEARRVHASD
jgi:LysR family cys regulon transcriptional activator